MVAGGDAAEQVVRLTLEGVEVAAKITGEGAKNLAILLAAVLREEHKTKGKARLSSMIRSGKPLKVYSIRNKDLQKFSQEAGRYGVLYCVLRNKDDKSDSASVDIIARADDAPQIDRIINRFNLASVDKDAVVSEVKKDIEARKVKEAGNGEKSYADVILEKALKKPEREEEKDVNPSLARTEKSPLSEQNSMNENRSGEGICDQIKKPSVKDKLNEYKKKSEKSRENMTRPAKLKTVKKGKER